jgi:hypothetical protein
VRETRLHVPERGQKARFYGNHDILDVALLFQVDSSDRRLSVVDQHVDAEVRAGLRECLFANVGDRHRRAGLDQRTRHALTDSPRRSGDDRDFVVECVRANPTSALPCRLRPETW